MLDALDLITIVIPPALPAAMTIGNENILVMAESYTTVYALYLNFRQHLCSKKTYEEKHFLHINQND